MELLPGNSTSFSGEGFSTCTVCAYHESGHIIFAYLCGYRCHFAKMTRDKEDNGYTSIALIDYGKDREFAERFNSGTTDLSYFKSLPLGERLACLEAGRRLARIYLGGSSAAAIFNNQGNFPVPLPVQVDYQDLLRTEFIHYVISEVSNEKEEEHFIEHGLQEALYTLANVNIWKALTVLATALEDKGQLEGDEMEHILEEHGILFVAGVPG
jgi:hypothetical protein